MEDASCLDADTLVLTPRPTLNWLSKAKFVKEQLFWSASKYIASFFAWGSCVHCTTKWNKVTYQGYVTNAMVSSWRWSLLVFTIKPNGILSLGEPGLEPKCATILDLPHHMHVHYTQICFQWVFVHSQNIVVWIFSRYLVVWNEPPCLTFIPIR